MTSQGHVTTASLNQAHKEDNREVFFIRLYLKKFCVSILETSHSKLQDPEQYNVEVWSWSDYEPQSYQQKVWCRRMLVLH